jgi:hypothetical protein
LPISILFEEGDDRLRNDEPDISLKAVLKPLELSDLFIPPRRRVDPDLIPLHADRKTPDIIGPGVESPAAREIETGMVPVAGQYPVLEGPSVQREAHVRASVIKSVERALMQEEGDGMSFHLEDHTALFFEICNLGYLDKS